MDLVKKHIIKNNTKLLLIVLDGLGGLPVENGKTELEMAKTPNLDRLAKESALGMHIPVDYGITPGSGPGHLGIFGYNPVEYQIGRGILEALGLGLELKDTDIAVRGNYATVEEFNGKLIVKDRRAGRISSEENKRITQKLASAVKNIGDVQVILSPGMEHRFAMILRFPTPLPEGSDRLPDTDPQKEGYEPIIPQGDGVAMVVREFLKRAQEVLKDEPKANYVLLRGFSQKPKIESFEEKFGLRACAIAVYPMYRGLASLVGMEVFKAESLQEQIKLLKDLWENYDYFFFHIKKTDSYGEDGNWRGKIQVIEEFDGLIPEFLSLKPQVLVITGDHSTPSVLKGHSWHPVPVLLHSPYVLGRTSERFTERECLKGELGIFPAFKLMNLMLAHSLRLSKFGA
ncbi:2,3-bisphosphoglycerate-independent phosphoglycerate mutase [Hydrogenobacter hydrogenophilus]|uniref:Probable 2,3-bisphosphoglycerate-independent phosphoglycerate mutase n=1 Tax=Hydrogenobacter hydrogenophilus TaxID=35835 RepID=A0A285P2P2_9AQUI|nr:2,3-bisphosphoglycerate-independent phosphoglycerate mutase [Hydrogenobacter hydrogenophilus]SNZ15995.1 2,3-bisphosphoglycerate-independent phosphoglycerate mutase [Hydrogenobacter hydrogenophilus]